MKVHNWCYKLLVQCWHSCQEKCAYSTTEVRLRSCSSVWMHGSICGSGWGLIFFLLFFSLLWSVNLTLFPNPAWHLDLQDSLLMLNRVWGSWDGTRGGTLLECSFVDWQNSFCWSLKLPLNLYSTAAMEINCAFLSMEQKKIHFAHWLFVLKWFFEGQWLI